MLDLRNGIQSQDTFNRVISGIDYEEFEKCFAKWTTGLMEKSRRREIINLDGKTVRGAKTKVGKLLVHTVNAWAGLKKKNKKQEKTEERSNEIVAIPEILDLLFVEMSIVKKEKKKDSE